MSVPAPFPLEAYLARIGWSGPMDPTPAGLIALHRRQLLAIPFENLDPLGGRPVSLEPADLARKLIVERRGGYCFELNGLFLLALQALGFATVSLCARVQITPGNYGPRSHQITLVTFPDGARWLADVGFGGNGLIEAIPFELDREFDQGLDRFRLVVDTIYGCRLEHRRSDGWRVNYAFSLDPYLTSDFRALNYFISRSPDSIFTRLPICVRTTSTERRILVADQFKVRSKDGTTSRTLASAEKMREILNRHFELFPPDDLELPDPTPSPAGMREL